MTATIMHDNATRFVRWIATAYYRTDNGLVDVQHDIMELEELQDLIERGPDWNTIERIEIVLSDKSEPDLTVEKAAQR